jgi:hypothetical protein
MNRREIETTSFGVEAAARSCVHVAAVIVLAALQSLYAKPVRRTRDSLPTRCGAVCRTIPTPLTQVPDSTCEIVADWRRLGFDLAGVGLFLQTFAFVIDRLHPDYFLRIEQKLSISVLSDP